MSSQLVDSIQDSKGDIRGGPSISLAQRVALLRSAMLAEVKPEDMAAIMRKLIELAGEGNLQAAKLVLSYTLGKPEAVVKKQSAASAAEVVGVDAAESAATSEAVRSATQPVRPIEELVGVGGLQDVLSVPPSPNGLFDDLRELRLITPRKEKHTPERKKHGR